MVVRCMITELTCNHNTQTHCYFGLRDFKNNSQVSHLPPGLEKVKSRLFDWRAGEQSSHPSLFILLAITMKTRASPTNKAVDMVIFLFNVVSRNKKFQSCIVLTLFWTGFCSLLQNVHSLNHREKSFPAWNLFYIANFWQHSRVLYSSPTHAHFFFKKKQVLFRLSQTKMQSHQPWRKTALFWECSQFIQNPDERQEHRYSPLCALNRSLAPREKFCTSNGNDRDTFTSAESL